MFRPSVSSARRLIFLRPSSHFNHRLRHAVQKGAASSLVMVDHRGMFSRQSRHFSDRLLGHSPMAPKAPTPKSELLAGEEESRIPTERDVQIAGGVWNPTSAKRDKIAELKVELLENQYTLDDAATEEQTRDLHLTDGIQWIVYTTEQCRLPEHEAAKPPSVVIVPDEKEKEKDEKATDDVPAATTTETPKLLAELDPTQWETDPGLLDVVGWIADQETSIQSTVPDSQLSQEQWETYLQELMQKLDEILATLPPGRYCPHVRDFTTVPETVVQMSNKEHAQDALRTELQQELSASPEQQQLTTVGNKLLARYRLQLTRATCEHLFTNWDALTTLSDEALDRLAVQVDGNKDESSQPELESQKATMSLVLLNHVLRACLTGNAIDRVDTMWDLVDLNGDGLLEQPDMVKVATFTVAPVQAAILTLFEDAVEATPVKVVPDSSKQPGYFARRRETKAKKQLVKAFSRATTAHFDDEIEMPHRLRCIYAWAEKAHQDNTIDSVLIESSGWSGRKRYVELHPKISLPEFREVQQIHFTHLDRIGWEITKSFREDLWVLQGKGRQNAELRRDCMAFLLVVSLVDYGIILL